MPLLTCAWLTLFFVLILRRTQPQSDTLSMERVNELEQKIKNLDPKIKLKAKVTTSDVARGVNDEDGAAAPTKIAANADGGAETSSDSTASDAAPDSSSREAVEVDEDKAFSFSTAGRLAAAAASGKVYSRTDADAMPSVTTASPASSPPRGLSERSSLDELARRASRAKAASDDSARGTGKSEGGRRKGAKKQDRSTKKAGSASKAGSKK